MIEELSYRLYGEKEEVITLGKIPETMTVTLKQTRELHGLKQSKAAEILGISTDTLGNDERGKSYPDIPILKKLKRYMEFHIIGLFFLPLDFGLSENII